MLKLRSVLAGSGVSMLALSAACGAAGWPFGTSYQTAAIVDAQGFGRPVTAATIDIPSGWRAQGGVTWNRQTSCVGNSVLFQWSAQSPDGAQAVEVMPGFDWQVKGADIQMHPCPVASISTVRQYLLVLVQQRRPGAQVLAYRDRPDIVAEQPPRQPDPPGMPPRKVWQEAGELMIATTTQGKEMRETLSALATFSAMNASGRRFVVGNVSAAVGVRAPAGKIEAAASERIRKSMRLDPAWLAETNANLKKAASAHGARQRQRIQAWHENEMAAISARGAAQRAAIRSDTIREVGRINAEGYARRQESQDRMHRNNVDTLREINRYHDPGSNRQVELSSHQNHGWRLDNGAYVSTNNPNFDPQRDLGVGGQEMKRVK
ncbi:MAG: hypothetical protein KAX84_08050 [Burkholderiales bacterium]|nr:hypothetical protein [Burkholderiales bacterium]